MNAEMTVITLAVKTMTSLEIVEVINSLRNEGKVELRHDHFMSKVAKVLGKAAPKFLGTAFYLANGAKREQSIYNLPKREAELMVMSESYEVQAKVYDRMAELEVAVKYASIPNFDDPLAAARAWIVERENVVLLSATIQDQAPKVEFHDAVTADETLYGMAEAAKILHMKPNAFIKWLRDMRYLRKDNTPYQQFISYLQPAFYRHTKPDGELAPATTFVTSKGLPYFQKKLTKEFV